MNKQPLSSRRQSFSVYLTSPSTSVFIYANVAYFSFPAGAEALLSEDSNTSCPLSRWAIKAGPPPGLRQTLLKEAGDGTSQWKGCTALCLHYRVEMRTPWVYMCVGLCVYLCMFVYFLFFSFFIKKRYRSRPMIPSSSYDLIGKKKYTKVSSVL